MYACMLDPLVRNYQNRRRSDKTFRQLGYKKSRGARSVSNLESQIQHKPLAINEKTLPLFPLQITSYT